MTLYLLRHARAGRRSAWKGDDELRPLSKVGRRQAEGLVDVLGPCPTSSRSSRAPTCVAPDGGAPRRATSGSTVDVADELPKVSRSRRPCGWSRRCPVTATPCCAPTATSSRRCSPTSRPTASRSASCRMEKGSVWALETRTAASPRPPTSRPPSPRSRCVAQPVRGRNARRLDLRHGGGDLAVPHAPVPWFRPAPGPGGSQGRRSESGP